MAVVPEREVLRVRNLNPEEMVRLALMVQAEAGFTPKAERTAAVLHRILPDRASYPEV